MRFTALQSVVNNRPVGSLGSPPPPCPRRFRREMRFLPVAVPRSLAQTGSSSRASLLFGVLPFLARPAPPGVEHLPWGCVSLFATSTAGIVTTGLPNPPPSVLGVSHALDGLLRHRPCGFISPHCHVQGSTLQGFVPRAQPLHLVGAACPLVVGENSLPAVAHQRHDLPPRPQGFAPCPSPLPTRQLLTAGPARSPPGFPLLQVLPLRTVRTPSRPLPLMAFMKEPSSRSPH